MSEREGGGPVELNVDADYVRLIVAKGRAAMFAMPSSEADMPEAALELDAATEVQATDASLLSDETAQDATRDETAAMIDSLNIDEQAELIALTWIGRGDYEPMEIEAAVQEAKARATGPASRTLFEIDVFPSHLANGLDAYEAWRGRQPA